MRLELEQNHTHPGFDLASDAAVENRTAEAANLLREGIRAAQSGNRAAARTALLKAAELDPQSESAWLWLSSISEYPEELLAFLTNVLEINPRNARALEWSAATRSLLAKNLVQRGIDAAESNQKDLAAQHLNQALEYDEKNAMAWLWLASMCESNEGKLSYLEKVLEFDPDNETARTGYQAARNSIREGLLNEARAAAVTGNSQSANELLDAVIAEEPDAEDAWVLKSHIAVGFDEKIAAFRRVLEINPENGVARSGLDSLTAIMDAVAVKPAAEEVAAEPQAQAFEQAPQAEVTVQEASAETVENAETPWNDAVSDPPVAEVPEEEDVAPSPFDSYADEPVVDLNGTMLMTASDFGFSLEDLPEVRDETAVSFENGSASAVEAPAAIEDEQPVAAEEVPYHFQLAKSFDDQPAASVEEREEITFELASEAPNAETAELPFINVADDAAFPVVEEVNEEPVQAEAEFGEAAIAAPNGNPFNSEEFRNEPDAYQTVISVDLDAEMQAAVQNYDPFPAASAVKDNGFNVPFDASLYSGTIPMPVGDLDEPAPSLPTGFETRVLHPAVANEPKPPIATAACPFCSTENDSQAIACNSCLAVLTLADLELILANHHADKTVLRQAVEQMERERIFRDLTEAELTTLAIGHLNLRNLQFGYDYLYEAAQQNPNNVVLSSQANALLIRLEEIKQQAEAHEGMVKGKTILVVDDSATVRKLIAGKLEKCGHEVFCSGDGVEAMDQLATLKPDLILLDITMPRMDGYQVCKLIRSGEATKDTPVVMISGKDGFFDKVRGRMAGASGYITKPFGPETLMKAVESYLNQAN